MAYLSLKRTASIDVYKRQFPNHVKMWRDKRIPKGWDVSETEVPNAALQTMERVYTVSYTHLDVYKRQILLRCKYRLYI